MSRTGLSSPLQADGERSLGAALTQRPDGEASVSGRRDYVREPLVQIFSTPRFLALGGRASKKCQGTKSRVVGGRSAASAMAVKPDFSGLTFSSILWFDLRASSFIGTLTSAERGAQDLPRTSQ
jgi:hypothetical protein